MRTPLSTTAHAQDSAHSTLLHWDIQTKCNNNFQHNKCKLLINSFTIYLNSPHPPIIRYPSVLLTRHDRFRIILRVCRRHQVVVLNQYIQYIRCDIRREAGSQSNVLHSHVQQSQQDCSCFLLQMTQGKLVQMIREVRCKSDSQKKDKLIT